MSTYKKERIPVTRDEWLKQRSKGLGGSDAGAVMGLNPYKSAYSLWAEKTGLITNYVQENEAIRLGNDLEDYVAKRFAKQENKKIKRSSYCYQSKKFPFMRANVDRLIVGENAALECKTANPFKDGDYSKDIIPPTYYCQCLHYMAVCGFDQMYLAVLVFQKGFYTYVIDRNDAGVEADIQALIQAEKDFWAHVVNGEAPDVDGSESTAQTLKQLHKDELKTVFDLTEYDKKLDEIQELKEQQKELKTRQKELKTRQKTLENELKEVLIGCDYGQSSIYNVSAKVTTSSRFDTDKFKKENLKIYNSYKKETQTQTLRISKRKDI